MQAHNGPHPPKIAIHRVDLPVFNAESCFATQPRLPGLPWPMLGASTSTAIYWQENHGKSPMKIPNFSIQLIKEIRNSFEQSNSAEFWNSFSEFDLIRFQDLAISRALKAGVPRYAGLLNPGVQASSHVWTCPQSPQGSEKARDWERGPRDDMMTGKISTTGTFQVVEIDHIALEHLEEFEDLCAKTDLTLSWKLYENCDCAQAYSVSVCPHQVGVGSVPGLALNLPAFDKFITS